MHLRRTLLLFALVLGLTALAATLAPAPHEHPPAVTQPTVPAAVPKATGERELTFQYPLAGAGRRPVRHVRPEEHVVVVVAAAGPGQAQIPDLGRTASLTVDSPARIDMLAPPPGRYDVLFADPNGESTRVGAIVSR